MPFRLAAVRAGLELVADTSPPVLRRIPGFKLPAASRRGGSADASQTAFDVIRAYLRLLGPATPKLVAGYLDAPVADVKGRWPSDTVEVSVAGETRWVLAADVDAVAGPTAPATRLLGPYDLFLQAKDRDLLVPDPVRAKTLWPVLGRPGAVLRDGEIIGSWRPRAAGRKLTVRVDLWSTVPAKTRAAIGEQAQRLADFRSVELSGVDFEG